MKHATSSIVLEEKEVLKSGAKQMQCMWEDLRERRESMSRMWVRREDKDSYAHS